MASTPAGRAVTGAYRLAQGRVSARVVADVLGIWRLLDPLRLSDPGRTEQVLAALARHRDDSAELAADYYRDFRRAEVPRGCGVRAAPRCGRHLRAVATPSADLSAGDRHAHRCPAHPWRLGPRAGPGQGRSRRRGDQLTARTRGRA
ncbi:hypothetical protein [Amycolatopsis sp. NPDC004169]|uniref:hypothetical protein n=1 Tax=Amycolatopsis sp. NPDC004169 TaxID=3154453 RepID=UPI0033B04585